MASDRFDHLFICPSNFAQSLSFYVDILGWAVVSEWTDNHGKRGAILNGGGVRLVLAEAHADAPGAGAITNKIAPHSPALHLDIHDAARRFSEIPPGAHIVQPPEDNHWGTRWFVLRDPDGNLIAFNELRQKS
ncbi:MAG: VOC family protein [Usitatibacteraceae bacterium]